MQTIATAILTGILTIIGGLIVYYVTRQEPELRYSITKADPFYGSSTATAIYKLEISNTGKKEIDGLMATITFPDETVADRRVTSNSGVIFTEKAAKDSDQVEADVFNPGDRIDASFLVNFEIAPLDPKVSVRGKGVTGKLISALGSSSDSSSLYLIFAGISVSFVSLISGRLAAGKLLPDAAHLQDVRDLLALGCFLADLPDEGQRILDSRKCHYWSQSERIAAVYVSNPAGAEKAAKALEIVLEYGVKMSVTSEPIFNYNIARLWLAAGNEERAVSRIKVAVSSKSPFVRKRLDHSQPMKALVQKNPGILPEEWRPKATGV